MTLCWPHFASQGVFDMLQQFDRSEFMSNSTIMQQVPAFLQRLGMFGRSGNVLDTGTHLDIQDKPKDRLCPVALDLRRLLHSDQVEWTQIKSGDGSKPWYLVNPKIAGIYGCSSFIPLKCIYRYWPIPISCVSWFLSPGRCAEPAALCRRTSGRNSAGCASGAEASCIWAVENTHQLDPVGWCYIWVWTWKCWVNLPNDL